jgi:hypothetical protein
LQFGIQKYSSNVIEKCVEKADEVKILFSFLTSLIGTYQGILLDFVKGQRNEEYA